MINSKKLSDYKKEKIIKLFFYFIFFNVNKNDIIILFINVIVILEYKIFLIFSTYR